MTAPKISEKSTDLIIKLSLIVVAYFLFAKPILNFLGITKSGKDRQRQKELENPDSPFKITYWQKFNPNAYSPAGVKLTQQRKKELLQVAMQIYNAFGYFYDEEAEVAAAFYRLKTKAEVSIVAFIFQDNYKKDLLSYLGDGKGYMPQNGLSDYDISIIINYVNKLPKT